ncbi:MAG: beta-L-arabinofuranosidase domain-containing protein [Candidatus Sulfotelmatobacter sp.]
MCDQKEVLSVEKVVRGADLDRREFLRLALMSSGVALAPTPFFGVDNVSSAPGAAYAKFRSLPPGAVRPAGWLRLYLEKQAQQLGSKLADVSWPFTEAYWDGEEKAESWWPWEQRAYWIDGAGRLALVLNDQQLMQRVGAPIDYTLTHAAANRYLGPQNFSDPKGDFHRWPHAIFFRALAAFSEAQQRNDIPDLMRQHYLSDQASYGEPLRNIMNVESMLWCYGQTGDQKLLALAENAWRDYLKFAGETEHGNLSEMQVYGAGPIMAHGVTYIETAKQPAILYLYTGNEEYLRFALAAQRRIFDHHMLIDGIPSTTEDYRTRTALDSHETCDIADHTWSWGYMLMATGDGLWADRVERACLNAGMGCLKKDWKALQYFSCPNQFLATLNSDHNVLIHGGRLMSFQPNPGEDSACCAGNVHRVFPNYVIRMWMKDADDGLAATLYGPSKLSTTVGKDRREIEIVQETDYPFGEKIDFIIGTKQPVEFPLSLRIPEWCSAPALAMNGKPIPLPPINRGFVQLRRRFRANDKISLTLPMKFSTSRWPQNGIGIEHGPLVYSLAIQEKWTSVVEQKYSTGEFPDWNAVPVSSWEYGLMTNAGTSAVRATLERKPMTADPWTDPPVSVKVEARKIEGWDLQKNPDNLEQMFTPPLPDVQTARMNEAAEHITLTPYGATHLRLTIFPEVTKQSRKTSG